MNKQRVQLVIADLLKSTVLNSLYPNNVRDSGLPLKMYHSEMFDRAVTEDLLQGRSFKDILNTLGNIYDYRELTDEEYESDEFKRTVARLVRNHWTRGIHNQKFYDFLDESKLRNYKTNEASMLNGFASPDTVEYIQYKLADAMMKQNPKATQADYELLVERLKDIEVDMPRRRDILAVFTKVFYEHEGYLLQGELDNFKSKYMKDSNMRLVDLFFHGEFTKNVPPVKNYIATLMKVGVEYFRKAKQQPIESDPKAIRSGQFRLVNSLVVYFNNHPEELKSTKGIPLVEYYTCPDTLAKELVHGLDNLLTPRIDQMVKDDNYFDIQHPSRFEELYPRYFQDVVQKVLHRLDSTDTTKTELRVPRLIPQNLQGNDEFRALEEGEKRYLVAVDREQIGGSHYPRAFLDVFKERVQGVVKEPYEQGQSGVYLRNQATPSLVKKMDRANNILSHKANKDRLTELNIKGNYNPRDLNVTFMFKDPQSESPNFLCFISFTPNAVRFQTKNHSNSEINNNGIYLGVSAYNRTATKRVNVLPVNAVKEYLEYGFKQLNVSKDIEQAITEVIIKTYDLRHRNLLLTGVSQF